MQIGSFIRVVGGFYLPNNICDENLLTTTIFDVNFELL